MFATLVGRLAQFLIALVSVRVMTTLLPPDELGKVSLITTSTAFFALFLINPVGMFVNRRLHGWLDSGVLKHYVHVYGLYIVAVAAAASVLVAAAMQAGLLEIGVAPAAVAALVAASLVFNTINQTLVPSLNMVGRVKPFIALTLGTLLASLCLSVTFVRSFGPTAPWWLAGLIAGQAIFAAWGYGVFFEHGRAAGVPAPIDRQRLRSLAAFCWPAAIAVGLNWAQMQGYRFLIASESGLVELGLFTAGYGIAAAMLSAMEQILTTWFQPTFYRDANSANARSHDQAWRRYASVMLPLSIVGLFAVLAGARDLVALMLGPAYQSVAPYVMLGAFAEWSRVLVGVFVLIAHLKLRTALLIVPSAIGAALTLLLIAVLLPRYGLYTAPLSVAVGGLAVCVFLHRSARAERHDAALPWRRLVIAAASGLAVLAVMQGVRPALEPLGWPGRLIDLGLVAALLSPVVWLQLSSARQSRNP